ncbi:MAG: SMC-Scp complex subunit ScpB [Nanoarchaeota archaeon]|nr:SMC-Scp complex subunit ScpB [Nanoarchaeota archaeon]
MEGEYFSEKTVDEIDSAQDNENLKKVEAALFVAGRFLSTQELVALTDLNPILLNQTLDKLKDNYVGGAIEIVNKNDLWKMDVFGDYKDIVNRLATGSAEFTKAEQETLAVIAHKQPVTQSKMVLMRGNKAYDHVKKFLGLGLIKGKKLGRTKELTLCDEFYDYFSLQKKERVFEKSEGGDRPSVVGRERVFEGGESGGEKMGWGGESEEVETVSPKAISNS